MLNCFEKILYFLSGVILYFHIFTNVFVFDERKITLFIKYENFKKPFSVPKLITNIPSDSFESVTKTGSYEIATEGLKKAYQ